MSGNEAKPPRLRALSEIQEIRDSLARVLEAEAKLADKKYFNESDKEEDARRILNTKKQLYDRIKLIVENAVRRK